MKLKKVLIILITLIVVVVVSTLLHYKNMNYISENWNIDFPSENTIVYQVKPFLHLLMMEYIMRYRNLKAKNSLLH